MGSDDEAARKQTDNQVKANAVRLKRLEEPEKSAIHSERHERSPSPVYGFPPSVVGNNGQSTQLAELGLGLPLPLLISQPCLVDLVC